jgi:hypothetical protein
MVTFTQRFYELSGRVTTFSGIALCLKVVPLKAVTFSDVSIEFADRAVIVGMLATMVIYLLFCVAAEATKDVTRQMNKDRAEPAPAFGGGSSIRLIDPGQETLSHRVYLIAAKLSIALEAVFPILFGSFVAVLCFSEILSFSRLMIKVVTSAFSFA